MLVNLVVKDGRCRSEGNVGIKFVKLRTVLEGGCRVAKDGSISFAESGHNLDMWKQVFPDSDIIKHANLDDQFASLAEYNRPAHIFKRSPLPWQKEADDKLQRLIDIKSPLNCFAFFYSAGGGKSLSLTNMITKLYCLGEIDAAIIIVPNILVGSQWTNDNGALNRDTQDDIASKSWLWKKGKKATEEYESVKTFDGLQTLVMNIDAVRTPDGYKRLDDFIKHHRGRVLYSIDEVHGINNTTSQRHKKNVELASKCVWRAGLSGTPISKSLVNMYAIFRFLNPSVFGFKYAKGFMNEYCVMRWNGFADEVVGSKNVEQLYEKIAPVSTRQ